MDRAKDHLVDEPPISTAPAAQEIADAVEPDLDVSLSKQRFLESARAIDFLAPLRRHPFVTVATAAAIGVVAASPAVARAVPVAKASIRKSGLLSQIAQQALTQLAARWAQRRAQQATNEVEPPTTPP
jgi:hypothetical protein